MVNHLPLARPRRRHGGPEIPLYQHDEAARPLASGIAKQEMPRAISRRTIDPRRRDAGPSHELLKRKQAASSGRPAQRVALGRRCIVRKPMAFVRRAAQHILDAKLRAQIGIELKALHAQLTTNPVCSVTHDQGRSLTTGRPRGGDARRAAVLAGRHAPRGLPTTGQRFVAGLHFTARRHMKFPRRHDPQGGRPAGGPSHSVNARGHRRQQPASSERFGRARRFP